MAPLDLPAVAAAAEGAADLARAEILPRFRDVATEIKGDGSPVTEADRAAERAIRDHLHARFPDFAVTGEEYGDEAGDGPRWIVDPIDGTIGFSRGIPLFTTLIALVEDGEPVFGLIDCPALDERYVGWRDGGCRRNGTPVQVSREDDLGRALVAHGDLFCFDEFGARDTFLRLTREVRLLRGYTDAFGHAQVLGGGVDAMIDLSLNLWDAAATQVLVREAGGSCRVCRGPNDKLGLVFGSPPLVEQIAAFLPPDLR